MIAFVLIIIGALTIKGIINRTGSILSGRRGVRFFQHLYTVMVQLGKGVVVSSTSTMATWLAPIVMLASMLCASLLLPLGSYGSVLAFRGDVIVFCALLALSRAAMVWAAMDSGSSFQGMGAARDALFSMLVEPAFYLLLATLALITGYDSFSALFVRFENMSLNMLILSIVVGYGFYKIMLVDCGRVPAGDPATHLELTMTHEVMVLDLSGFDLALFSLAQWVKLSIFVMLVANSLIPAHVDGGLLFALYILALLIVGIAVGVGETFRARNAMNKNPTYVASISAIGLLAFIVAYMLITNQL